jgi:hypothetical protein
VCKEVELREEVEQWASFFFCLPLAIAMVLVIRGEGGVSAVSTRIYIGIPSDWGGRDG